MHSIDYDSTTAFVPLPRVFQRRRMTDIEYVEKVRKSLRWWDRRRWLGVVFYVALIAAILSLCFRAIDLVQGMIALLPPQNPIPKSFLLLGIGIGSSMGFSLQSSVWGLLTAISGLRSERLLVRYHDGLRALICDDGPPFWFAECLKLRQNLSNY